ncbi:hypothetical protein ACH5RR_039453 [Cinchona calisaya]|uniref:Uncharacterized protein n=1 Tax=Cinchona calisaya TaxID=153742 RepID=A0ABD2Y108_9GENT
MKFGYHLHLLENIEQFLHLGMTYDGWIIEVVCTSSEQPATGLGLQRLANKLQRLKHYLCNWNYSTFGNVFDAIKEAVKEVVVAQQQFELYPIESN